MSVTSIHFVGLFVVLMNSGAGLHILLPHFPGTPFADHMSAIQYSPDQVSKVSWPGVTPCGPDGTLRCAPIDVETITFSGANDPAPTDIIGAIPHLRCCCPSMTGIQAKYKDPTAKDKLSAHIFVERGVAEAITDANGLTDTWVTMHSSDKAGITLTSSSAAGSFAIVFNPGAEFTILNSMTSTSTTLPHYRAYYLMGVGSSDCTAVPTDGPPCAASATDCPLKKVVGTTANTAAAKRKVAAGSKPSARTPMTPLEMTGDCSSTHWP